MIDMEGRKFLFITIDVDWIPGSEEGLEKFIQICEDYKIKPTIFVAGEFTRVCKDILNYAKSKGYSIGCHGLRHGLDLEENYRFTDYKTQKNWLERATEKIGEIVGERPRYFRAPFLWVSETLFKVLEELDYEIDSSVPARRYDSFFGMVDWIKYFRAPLEPYYPDPSYLARKSENRNSKILEIPPSAFVIPITLSSLRRLGLLPTLSAAYMIGNFSPILNFYCHPYEFIEPEKCLFNIKMPKRNFKNSGKKAVELFKRFVEKLLSLGYKSLTFDEFKYEFGK